MLMTSSKALKLKNGSTIHYRHLPRVQCLRAARVDLYETYFRCNGDYLRRTRFQRFWMYLRLAHLREAFRCLIRG